MLWFNEEKGFGFIATEEDERLYVPGTGFAEAPPEGPCAGRAVAFAITERNGQREAENVVLVEDVSPRRARRRRSG